MIYQEPISPFIGNNGSAFQPNCRESNQKARKSIYLWFNLPLSSQRNQWSNYCSRNFIQRDSCLAIDEINLILKDNIRVFIINPPTNDYFQFISSKMKCLIAALFGNKNWKACQMAITLALRYKHSNAMVFDLAATENAKRFQILDPFFYIVNL